MKSFTLELSEAEAKELLEMVTPDGLPPSEPLAAVMQTLNAEVSGEFSE